MRKMKELSIEYDRDFCHWLEQNVALLRAGKLTEIDVENIAEELESMGKSQHAELVSRLAVLLMHLLKWQYQPEKCSRSWELTIIEQRQEVLELLEDSPSLKHDVTDKIARAYKKSLIKAERETGIHFTKFPKNCPYSLNQILDEDFYP
jgi:nitrous oxide reductase